MFAVEAFEMRSSHWSPQGGALIISSSRAGGFNLDNYRVKRPPLYSAVRRPISPLTSEVAAAASLLNRHIAGSFSYCRWMECVQTGRPGWARPGQVRLDQIRLDQTIPGQVRPDQNTPGKARQGQNRPDTRYQARPNQTRPEQIT